MGYRAMTTRAYGLLRTTVGWLALGTGFNICQRVLDAIIDSGVGHVAWLAWMR